ncbi:MAG: OmpA family protein [Bacteroidota bacterium]
MIKLRLRSAFIAAIVLPLFFAGCASQLQQEQPRQQEPQVETAAGLDNQTSPTETAIGNAVKPENVTEEFPAIAEETTVFFTLGSAALSYREKRKLEIIAERLAEDRDLRVTLLGYANDNGSSSFNLAVSDNRVTAVAAFLREHSVHSIQIKVQALGSEKVASNCRSSKCRQKFRRVDLLVAHGKWR